MKAVYKLHVVTRGQGRPVILLHGGMSTHRYWQDVASELDDQRQLYIPDMLGFGKSPKPRQGTYSLEQYVDCLEHTFKDVEFSEPPVLVGHSFGALVALRWAIQEPQRFKALVLSAPLLFEPERAHRQLASIALDDKIISNKVYGRLVVAGMGFGWMIPTRLATKVYKKKPKHVVEDATGFKRHVFRKLIKSKHFMEHVLKDLEEVRLPTRIIFGSGDVTNQHAHDEVKRICKSHKDCQLQVLEGGHNIPLEKTEALAKTILSV